MAQIERVKTGHQKKYVIHEEKEFSGENKKIKKIVTKHIFGMLFSCKHIKKQTLIKKY